MSSKDEVTETHTRYIDDDENCGNELWHDVCPPVFVIPDIPLRIHSLMLHERSPSRVSMIRWQYYIHGRKRGTSLYYGRENREMSPVLISLEYSPRVIIWDDLAKSIRIFNSSNKT
jgi:hypothetical protein